MLKINSNKPIFKNTTVYDSKLYKKFVIFHNNKYGNSYIFFTLIISLFLFYCIIINILEKSILHSFIFVFILIIFILLRFYLPLKKYKNSCKNYSKDKKIFIHYEFYNNYFKIIIKDKNTKKTSRFFYFRLNKVFEDSDYFYLYINKENAALISKNSFELGDAKDFAVFIKRKCFLKYKHE